MPIENDIKRYFSTNNIIAMGGVAGGLFINEVLVDKFEDVLTNNDITSKASVLVADSAVKLTAGLASYIGSEMLFENNLASTLLRAASIVIPGTILLDVYEFARGEQ
jgi:hypothetical protein